MIFSSFYNIKDLIPEIRSQIICIWAPIATPFAPRLFFIRFIDYKFKQ